MNLNALGVMEGSGQVLAEKLTLLPGKGARSLGSCQPHSPASKLMGVSFENLNMKMSKPLSRTGSQPETV